MNKNSKIIVALAAIITLVALFGGSGNTETKALDTPVQAVEIPAPAQSVNTPTPQPEPAVTKPEPNITEPAPQSVDVPPAKSISDPDPVTEETPASETKTDFAETIRMELTKKVLSEPKVTYNEYDKILLVQLHKEQSLGPESFRLTMFLDTMNTMIIAIKHMDMIDKITITGWTNMMDAQGNAQSEKVYRVDRSMVGADKVNWKNLMGAPDMLAAIDNNFDSVYWHPGVLK